MYLQASVLEAYKTIIYKIILGFTWSSAWCSPTTEYVTLPSLLEPDLLPVQIRDQD